MKGGDARCCQLGGAGGRAAAPRTPQAPWLTAAGGPGGPVCSVSRGRTRVRWMHSPAPFSPGSLQCHCKLMCSRETERRVFLRCPLTDQVLSKKPPAASLQGQRLLQREPRSAPLREREGAGTQAESPALSSSSGACFQTPRLKPSRIRLSFGRASTGSPGLETMGAFLPALGASFGVDRISHWRNGGRRRGRVAKRGCPLCLPPSFTSSRCPGVSGAWPHGPAPAGQAQRSLRLPAPDRVPRGPWPALAPPFRRRKAVAAPKVGPKKRRLSPHPVSVAPAAPAGLSKPRRRSARCAAALSCG